MSTAFVAVVRTGRVPAGAAGGPAQAATVRSLHDLATCPEPDESLAVLLEPALEPALTQLPAQAEAMLEALRVRDDPDGSVVLAGVRPVTDTLKRVSQDATLTGTADREHHRFVTAPVVARLGLLRKAMQRQPGAATPGEILAALAEEGATVLAAP